MRFLRNVKLKSLKNWILVNKVEVFLLVGILLIASFLRLWRIDEYLPFLGDEGRDVRVVRRFLTDFDLMFVGPRTSIGDMYLGPMYYYLIAPFLLLWRFSPTGPAVFVALLSVMTVFLVWFVARGWFGKVAGIAASLLYAISPVVVGLSRHSWNPNIMPFFSLLSIYNIWRVWSKKDFRWLVVLGISFAFVLQSHYLGLLLLPTLGIVWILSLLSVRLDPSIVKRFLVFSFFGFLVFGLLMSPLALFDYKHGWRNFGAMKKFFTERQTTVSVRPWTAIPTMWPIWQDQVVTRLVAGRQVRLGQVTSLILVFGLIYLFLKQKNFFTSPLMLVSLWLLVGVGGLGLYKQHIYDHYFGFIFTAPFLLAGSVFQKLWEGKLKFVVFLSLPFLLWVNIKDWPLRYPPQGQMQRVQKVDREIMADSKGAPFNFALIAKRNYEEGYLYFFELWEAQVREIDSQRSQETITDQLFVVCEDSWEQGQPDPCNPINHPKAEIANFGWSRIESEKEVSGVRLFKLVHTK